MKLLRNFFFNNTETINLKVLSNLAFIESPTASLIISKNGTILQINKAFSNLTGYTEDDALNKPMSFLKSGKHDHQFYKALWSNILNKKSYEFEVYNKCKDANLMLIREKITTVSLNNESYFICTLEDITGYNNLLKRHMHLATHDPLTGLANRILLDNRFSHALENATRYTKKVALIMCDLNKFKCINDTHGHNFGDEVLKKVAKKLTSTLRSSDTICRFGGDEFVILLEHLHSSDEAKRMVEKIKSTFPLSIVNENSQCNIGISVGYSVYPKDGTNYEQLSMIADQNMYDSKNSTLKLA